ncbi:MAG: DNA polymerase III subunit gamma/tau [Bacteroidales bacterium]
MDDYIVSARKYRPSTFLSVVGQRALTQTLKNAILTDKLAHAYLFCGPRGVGKTTCARIFAKSINCSNPTPEGEACNKCESCQAFNEQRSYNILELDAASNNSVDDIRTLIEQVRIPPQIGQYKVFIIDEVHMLSPSAFNAFLKTLEEPPRHVLFILATTEKHKILPTILSRCQIYDFQRISISDTVEHLRYVAQSEKIKAEDEALTVIAQKSDGGMRDALSIFDQMSAFSGGNITYKTVIENLNLLDYDYYFRLTEAFLSGDVPTALMVFDAVLRGGFEAQYFISGLSNHLRDLLVCKDSVTLPLLEVGENIAKKYEAQSARCSNEMLYQALDISNRCDMGYRTSNNKRLLVELSLIQICQLDEKKKSSNLYSVDTPSLKSIVPAMPQGEQLAVPPDGKVAEKPIAVTIPVQTKAPVVTVKKRAEKSVSATEKATSTISILMREKDENIVLEAEHEIEQNNQFTEEQLHSAWREYISTIPKETILVNTMKHSLPVLLDDFRFEVKVSNADQRTRLNDRRDTLIPFLKTLLGNTHIAMMVSEAEISEKQHIFSPLDKLNYMVSQNPEISQLYKAFDLEIS